MTQTLQHCWAADEAELLTETFCGQAYDPDNNAEHRASESMEESRSRPVCAVCHQRAMKHYADKLAQRKTTWMHLERIIWRDLITGQVRTETDKVIEVVVMDSTDGILVQDVASGTHRLIRKDNFILATLEGAAA